MENGETKDHVMTVLVDSMSLAKLGFFSGFIRDVFQESHKAIPDRCTMAIVRSKMCSNMGFKGLMQKRSQLHINYL